MLRLKVDENYPIFRNVASHEQTKAKVASSLKNSFRGSPNAVKFTVNKITLLGRPQNNFETNAFFLLFFPSFVK